MPTNFIYTITGAGIMIYSGPITAQIYQIINNKKGVVTCFWMTKSDAYIGFRH